MNRNAGASFGLLSSPRMPQMKSFPCFNRLPLLAVLGCLCMPALAQNGSMLGQSIRWKPVQSPFTPDPSNGAIAGGPGSDPNPGSPMYICRAQIQGSVVPGKWVQGNCNVPYGGSEQIMRSYEVAYGSARWGDIRAASMVWRRLGTTLTEAHSIHVAFTIHLIPEPITATSPASWFLTGRATSRWVETRWCRGRRLKCSMPRVADDRHILVHHHTRIRILTRSQCGLRNPIHHAGATIQV